MRPAATLLLALLLVPLLLASLAAQGASGPPPVIVARVNGVIDSSTVSYIQGVLEEAGRLGSPVVVLELNTPGGSLEAALDIAVMLRHSRVPVVGYVVEHWAMSAGTLVLMCSHVAAMQPGTLIGAVQPVVLTPGGGVEPVNESKILNPVYKEIELCMEMHGRNASLARLFVYRNLVLTAEEARRLHAVDFVAPGLYALLEEVNGTTVRLELGEEQLVIPPGSPVVVEEMPPGLLVAHVLSDPLVSGLLSSLGLLVILLALASRHPHLAALGIGLLILSLFGLGLAVNELAAALMVIGLVLLVVELVAIPGFGVVGATGILLIVVGALVAFTGHPVYVAGESLRWATEVLVAAVAPLAAFMAVAAVKAAEAVRRRPVYTPTPVGKTGRALDDIPPGGEGFVMVEGEYWRARNTGSEAIKRGDRVRVVGKDGAVLLVVRAEGGPRAS